MSSRIPDILIILLFLLYCSISIISFQFNKFNKFSSFSKITKFPSISTFPLTCMKLQVFDDEDMEISSLLPDKSSYHSFFSNSCNHYHELDINKFCLHDDLQLLLNQGMVKLEDVQKCWNEQYYMKDINEYENDNDIDLLNFKLSEDDSYDVLCNVLQQYANKYNNMKQSQVTEDLKYLEQQFYKLLDTTSSSGSSSGSSNNEFIKDTISYNTLIHWEEIQALIADKYCNIDDIRNIWKSIIGSFKKNINLNQFIQLNKAIDELVDGPDEDMDSINNSIYDESLPLDITNTNRVMANLMNNDLLADITDISRDEVGVITDMIALDPWEKTLDISIVFDKVFLKYLNDFFYKNSYENLLSFDSFCQWKDIQQLLKEGQVDNDCLNDIWLEALVEYDKKSNPTLNDKIQLETFIRLNIRLDILMDEIERALENLTNDDVEKYYKQEFEILSQGERLIGYHQLMEWSDLIELINNGVLSQERIDTLWFSLPKEPLGSYYKAKAKKDKDMKKGFGKVLQSDGITVDTFLMLNNEIEDIENSEII